MSIYKSLDLLSIFAIWAVVFAICMIGRNIIRGKQCIYRKVAVFRDGTENRRDSLQLTAIIFNTFPASVDCDTGCDGCH